MTQWVRDPALSLRFLGHCCGVDLIPGPEFLYARGAALKRQIKTSLFERLLLSSGNENKEKVLELALKGNEINKANA